MIRQINFILLTFLVFLIFSCKKEEFCLSKIYDTSIIELKWQELVCPGSFEGSPTYMEEIIHLGNQFAFPSFNPNNPYEFCYYQVVADSGSQIELDHQIVTFNLQTGQKNVVLNNTKVNGNLAWNKNGWIAYQNYENGAVYAVHTRTHLIVQVSSLDGFSVDKNLVWLNNGDTLIWGGNDVNHVPYLKLRDLNKEQEEILVFGSPAEINSEFTISKKNNILARIGSGFNAGSQFYIINFNVVQSTWNQFTLPINGVRFGRVNWHVDGERFYVPMSGSIEDAGLYEANYRTMSIKKLYDFCEKQYVSQAVCSPNGKYLIVQKVEREYLVNPNPPDDSPWGIDDQIVENSKLWLYDLETDKEVELPLD